MMRLAVAAAVLQAPAQVLALQRMRPQIINGSEVMTPSDNYSFHALPTLSEHSDQWLGCGASIISPTFGISAAHCFGGGKDPCQGPQSVALWVGDVHLDPWFSIRGKENGRSARVTADLICHPDFDGKCSHGHDIVLLKFLEPLPSWVKPVPLNVDGSATEALGSATTDIGYGITESSWDARFISDDPAESLRKVTLNVLSDDGAACAAVYAGGYGCSDLDSEGEATNIDQQICAGAADYPERDTCSGDSGSPMLNADGVQIGIVSYGGGPGEKMTGPGRMCGDPNYPGIYSRISAFKKFITDNVHDLPMV